MSLATCATAASPIGPSRISDAPAASSRPTASRAVSVSSLWRSASSQQTRWVVSRLDSVTRALAVAASGLLQVINQDQQRGAGCGFLAGFLQLAQQPEPLVRRLTEIVEPPGIDRRVFGKDQGIQDHLTCRGRCRSLAAGAGSCLSQADVGRHRYSALFQVRLIPVYRTLSFTPGFWSVSFTYAAAVSDALVWLAITKPPTVGIVLLTGFVAWIAFRAVLLAVRGSSFPPGRRFARQQTRLPDREALRPGAGGEGGAGRLLHCLMGRQALFTGRA
jgi:hypothetical protein